MVMGAFFQRYKAWLIAGAAVLLALAGAWLAGRGMTAGEIRAALARRLLQETSEAWQQAEKRAADLKARSQQLAEQYLTEQLSADARKKKIDALSDTDVRAELERRGYDKR
jgi:hypothetical protein